MPEDYQNYKNELEQDEKNQQRLTPVQPAPLGKNQKIAAIFLVFFAVLVIGMWMAQFKKSISQPFVYKGNNEETSNKAFSQQEDSEESLKTKDTDEDGLSDWDELNLYYTSPYLEDSDSDGFLDKDEIDSGNDPNCPVGRDCYSAGIVDGDGSVVSEGEVKKDNNLLEQFNSSLGIIENQQEVNKAQEETLKQVLQGQISAASLRQMLLEAGMDEELLNQISDEELMESYQDVLGE